MLQVTSQARVVVLKKRSFVVLAFFVSQVSTTIGVALHDSVEGADPPLDRIRFAPSRMLLGRLLPLILLGF